MLPWIATDTIDILAGSPIDDYGDTGAVSWDSPTVVATISGCSVQPLPANEYLLDRDAVVSRWQAWTPIAAVSSLNRVRHKGVIYEIDGSVQRWDDPTGLGLDHLTFFLRRVDG